MCVVGKKCRVKHLWVKLPKISIVGSQLPGKTVVGKTTHNYRVKQCRPPGVWLLTLRRLSWPNLFPVCFLFIFSFLFHLCFFVFNFWFWYFIFGACYFVFLTLCCCLAQGKMYGLHIFGVYFVLCFFLVFQTLCFLSRVQYLLLFFFVCLVFFILTVVSSDQTSFLSALQSASHYLPDCFDHYSCNFACSRSSQ